jgi:hypothetical protein
MKPLTKALLVALIQATIVCSLGAKLLYDRNTLPRAWFRAARYDPNLPIRGRYVSLQLEVKDPRSREEIEKKYLNRYGVGDGKSATPVFPPWATLGSECGSLEVRDGTPFARLGPESAGNVCPDLSLSSRKRDDEFTLSVNEPVLFFIPDTAQDPLHLARGEDLWVLATIPHKGPPRPISLGIKNVGEVSIRPLNLN